MTRKHARVGYPLTLLLAVMLLACLAPRAAAERRGLVVQLGCGDGAATAGLYADNLVNLLISARADQAIGWLVTR